MKFIELLESESIIINSIGTFNWLKCCNNYGHNSLKFNSIIRICEIRQDLFIKYFCQECGTFKEYQLNAIPKYKNIANRIYGEINEKK